ncbi:MAG: hypothetical protein M1321_00035 [Candidatus Marsarchaeota archaeon]|nr:hypothetical protein [Candidatus Marsarchaeota archaeon]
MDSGYETAAKEIVPAVRYALIKALKEKYNKREGYIAESLGMTQAAISKYLNGKCSAKVIATEKRIDAKFIDKYAKMIAEGNRGAAGMCICGVCNNLNGFGCSFSRAQPPATASA